MHNFFIACPPFDEPILVLEAYVLEHYNSARVQEIYQRNSLMITGTELSTIANIDWAQAACLTQGYAIDLNV